MKKRFIISLSIFLVSMITFIVFWHVFDEKYQLIFLLLFLIISIYTFLFLLGGVSKLLIYLFYGLITAMFIYYFQSYALAFVIMGTALFISNPLSMLENKLASKIDNPEPLTTYNLVSKKRRTFYLYRSNMKDYYHLPQVRKLYKNKSYYLLRQITTFVLFSLSTFLAIYQLKDIGLNLSEFNDYIWISFYYVIVLYIVASMIYKKGFSSAFRVAMMLVLPPIIHIIASNLNLDLFWRLSLSITLSLMTIGMIIYQIITYYQRVSYSAYHYYDSDENAEVFANALYEPFVYSESYNSIVKYSLTLSLDKFNERLKDILIYANLHHFIITAYLVKSNKIIIYTVFKTETKTRMYKFQNLLTKYFETKVSLDIKHDPQTALYEELFTHKPAYIVQRAVSLGKLLKELNVDSPLIISLFFYFKEQADLEEFSKIYSVAIIKLDETSETVRVDINIANTEYLIDIKIREVLLNAMIYNGQYIRILVHTQTTQL